MPPTTVFTSPGPAPTFSGEGHPPNKTGYQFGLVFWPILFGCRSSCPPDPRIHSALIVVSYTVLLVVLIWKLWTWKAKPVATPTAITTSSPSIPKPTSDVMQMARARGSPVHGRPLATQQASVPNPPPPAYIYPPRYDDNPRMKGSAPSIIRQSNFPLFFTLLTTFTDTATAPSGR